VVRDAGSRARILNVNIVDDQVHLIVATKIVITINYADLPYTFNLT